MPCHKLFDFEMSDQKVKDWQTGDPETDPEHKARKNVASPASREKGGWRRRRRLHIHRK